MVGWNTANTEDRLVETAAVKYAKDVACQIVLEGFFEVPLACVMQHEDDPQRM